MTRPCKTLLGEGVTANNGCYVKRDPTNNDYLSAFLFTMEEY